MKSLYKCNDMLVVFQCCFGESPIRNMAACACSIGSSLDLQLVEAGLEEL